MRTDYVTRHGIERSVLYAVIENRPRSVWLNIYFNKNMTDRYLFTTFKSMDECLEYLRADINGKRIVILNTEEVSV